MTNDLVEQLSDDRVFTDKGITVGVINLSISDHGMSVGMKWTPSVMSGTVPDYMRTMLVQQLRDNANQLEAEARTPGVSA